MKLIEAPEINRVAEVEARRATSFALVYEFEPLHQRTILPAYLHRANPGVKVRLEADLFGDLAGNLERLQPENAPGAAVVVEWSDLDPTGCPPPASAQPDHGSRPGLGGFLGFHRHLRYHSGLRRGIRH
jgi:hypothetical protein